MASTATKVEIKAYLWNEGDTPQELVWDGKDDYEAIRIALCHALEDQKKEFGRLEVTRTEPGIPNLPYKFEMLFRTFDDEYRGFQIVAGTDPDDLNKSYTMHRQYCAQKVYSPRELYAFKPVSQQKFLYHFLSVHLREEISYVYDIDLDAAEKDGRIDIRTLADQCPDGRRTWTLQTVWFDDKPVMVINSSGRDGDEYFSRWVTDPKLFQEMIIYIRGFFKDREDQGIEGLVSPDTIIPAMTEFYNATIHDYYDVEKQEAK